MPILCQIVPPRQRATGYGVMNLVSTSCGGLADWGFGVLRDAHVPLNIIFGIFAGVALFSVVLVLLVRPRSDARRGIKPGAMTFSDAHAHFMACRASTNYGRMVH